MNIMMNSELKNPFHRPWMTNKCAASGSGGKGLKGTIAGALIGGSEVCVTYPTEFVKTRLQLDDKAGAVRQYSGVIDVVKKTIKERGFFGLYRGLSVILIFSVPRIASRFGTFETMRGILADEKGDLSSFGRVFCGLSAGIAEAIIAVTPMETIKVKFIHDQQKKVPQYRGTFSGIMTILKQDGISGVYQGLVPTVMKQGSNQAIRFYTIETLKHYYRGDDSTVVVPKHFIALFAFTAATLSVVGNTPIDVVKTRMQGLDAKKYKNTLDCAKQIWTKERPMAFYKGVQARLIRVGLEVTITFTLYETIMEYFNKIWP